MYSAGNHESLKTITTDDLAPGGIMPREVFDEFFQEVQNSSELLSRVRTEDVANESTRIPKLGVGERLRRAQSENTTIAEVGVNTDYVDIDCVKGSVYWSLTKEDVENAVSGEALADTVFDMMTQQFSVDTEDLAVNSDETADDGATPTEDQLFLGQNNGWLNLAENGSMPTYAHDSIGDGSGAAQPINVELFNRLIMDMPSKYLDRSDPVFLTSRNQVQSFRNSLAGTESESAFMMLAGESDLTPFDYDVVGTSLWPDDKLMFTDPQNLIYAIFREVETDVVTDTDKTHENDLYARYAIRAKDDFAIEDQNAGVLATDIASPV